MTTTILRVITDNLCNVIQHKKNATLHILIMLNAYNTRQYTNTYDTLTCAHPYTYIRAKTRYYYAQEHQKLMNINELELCPLGCQSTQMTSPAA